MLCCSGKNRRWLWTAAVALIALVALGYYFKWPIVTNYWWFLIILLCPLMHLFMMGHGDGHGKHEEHGLPGRAEHGHPARALETGRSSKNEKDSHGFCH